MKKIFITLLLVVAGVTAQAQEELTWHTDLKKASEIARQEQKPLFLFFTGSDWCGWCIRLQNEVFKTPEFAKWAKEKAVLVELDFPRRTPQSNEIKLQNNEMQQLFAVQGYPTVWFVKPTITADGKSNFEQIGKSGYLAGGPSAWLASADQILTKFVPDPKPIAAKKSKTKKTATKKS
ncbi:MAG: thioredoxin family protein [Bacteroidota bacterium]